jgi:hypothetical protein
MTAIVFLVYALLPVLSAGSALAADPPHVKPLKLDHKTLDCWFGQEEGGWWRFELTATISGERGEGKLRIAHFSEAEGEPLVRDLFGDRMNKVKETSTAHTITLKLVKSEDDLPKHARRALEIVRERKDRKPFADPSPKGDRRIYNVEGPDYGTNRGLILMVSPNGVHRLIYFPRYGGPYAVTLEPRDSFDGPVKGDK